MATDKIWVVAESSGGAPTSLTLELLTKARSLGSVVEAVAWGGDVASTAGELGSHGASKVYDLGDLGDALPGSRVAAAIAAQVQAGNAPDLILIGTSYDGRDVAGRLSARIDRPVLTNLVDLTVEDGVPVAHHAIFGGTQMARSRFTAEGPGIFVVRAKSFAAEPAGGPAAEVAPLEVPDTGATDTARIRERHVEERTGPQLDEAEVVVSGGRGLGQADKYEMIEELAKLPKAAPGASRAIVDAGWVPYSYQVGQTGKTVKPSVYLACGISGAIQHTVGMKGAKYIIAINTDPDAPIFKFADLGVVGDVLKIVPALTEEIKKRKG